MTPYTPAAISYVRDNASLLSTATIAHTLGWDEDTLQRIALKHGIELSGAKPPQEMIFQEPKRDVDPYRVNGHVDIAIDATTSLEQIVASLPLRQAQFLATLKREIGGRYIPSTEIAERFGTTAHSVGSVAATVRAKLRTSRWTIDSKSWRGGGGHRLVTR